MFEVFKSIKNRQFYFHLKAKNGKIILASEGYTQKVHAIGGTESVRDHSKDKNAFNECRSTDSRYYFNLRAANNQVIGTSQMYSSKEGMRKGIRSVMRTAPEAVLTDLTV